MKNLLIAFALAIVTSIVVIWASTGNRPLPVKSVQVAETASTPTHAHSGLEDYAVKDRVPAYYTTAPNPKTLGPTLSPELFTGNKRLAYQAAKDIPEILAQLPCYCHCDRGHGHKSLHSCFESEHGENCGICINEALLAQNLQKQGKSVTEIRKQIIAAYGQP